MISFPVLLESEEERYHIKQHEKNLAFSDRDSLEGLCVDEFTEGRSDAENSEKFFEFW